MRLKAKLREQLRFLQRSSALFDKGHEEEALRLATSLRVIFYDSRGSVSLIKHNGLLNCQALSTSRGYGDYRDYLSHELDINSPEPVRMKPMLGEQFRPLPIDHWWRKESVFVHEGVQFSRERIVRSAANKDGGAHVDGELEPYYEILCAGEYAIGIEGNLEYGGGPPPFPQGVTVYPKNAHLALLRQFAHETLASARYYGWDS